MANLLRLFSVLVLVTFANSQFSEDTFDQTCASKKVLCFGIREDDRLNSKCTKNCTLAVAIFEDKNRQGKVRFQFYGSPMTDPSYFGSYIALGLSNDDRMGDDTVVQCTYDSIVKLSPNVSTSWNYGRNNQPSTDKSYLHYAWASVKGRTLYCDFTLDSSFYAGPQQGFGEKQSFNFKQGPGYYVFMAMGNYDTKTGEIKYHGNNRFPSTKPILNSENIVIHDPPRYSSSSAHLLSTISLGLFFLFKFIIFA